jgi:hypothetical protein
MVCVKVRMLLLKEECNLISCRLWSTFAWQLNHCCFHEIVSYASLSSLSGHDAGYATGLQAEFLFIKLCIGTLPWGASKLFQVLFVAFSHCTRNHFAAFLFELSFLCVLSVLVLASDKRLCCGSYCCCWCWLYISDCMACLQSSRKLMFFCKITYVDGFICIHIIFILFTNNDLF